MTDPPESKARSAIPFKRVWNIALRTSHIAASGVLLGGHLFAVEKSDLLPWLLATVITGLLLGFVEAFPQLVWFYQGRGLFVLIKLALLCSIPWIWSYRVAVLLLVVILASVGSHMPARFRYYSIVDRCVLK